MPALTPRGYPYSVPGDPADIPQALEDLALAVDTDVEAVSQTIIARPAFRLTGTTAVNMPLVVPSPSAFDNAVMSFNQTDAVTGGAMTPLAGPVTRVIPALPGFWWIQGIVTIPRAGAANLDAIGVSIQTASTTLVRHNTHIVPPATDGANNLVVTSGVFMNGTTDYLEMVVTINKTATSLGSFTINRRYLFGVRMTET